jgi:hypothetical protein
MRVLTALVVAAAIAGFAPSIVTAAESTGFRGVTLGATEADSYSMANRIGASRSLR